MTQSDHDLKDIFQNVMEHHATSVKFESVWNKKFNNERKNFMMKKFTTIPLIALMTILISFTFGFTSYTFIRNIDNTAYTFVNDSRVIGKWEAVDFVDKVEHFTPEQKSWYGELFLNSMVFIKDGQMLIAAGNSNLAYTPSTWTRDLVLNKQEKTASKYEIKVINGTTYMFYEWKSGDYVFRNMTPYYYVLKKVDSEDYSSFTVKRVVAEEKVDYPFVDDPRMKGQWESVDFVQAIDSFIPGEKGWLDDLYLTGLSFEENGILTISTLAGRYSNYSNLSWTKGLYLNKRDKLASKCEIKEMNGSAYMFFEWKNGDYVFRGSKPWYYVLKKVK